MRRYIVYDGRAAYDTDAASVLESLGRFPNLKSARRAAELSWAGVDYVLVSYSESDDGLTDETVHFDGEGE